MTGAAALRALLDGPHADVRDMVRAWLSRPGNAAAVDLPRERHREQVLAWAQELAAEGGTAIGLPRQYGGEGNVGRSVAAFETLAYGDLSLLVKAGVQFGLFGGAVLHLGTERHHAKYLRAIARMELPGCFAMTETGHGSNVQALRTTATYDPATDELVVHTPGADARKDYIGNAARDGRMAAVFAQLIVGGENRGVHALLVPLRDEDGNALPGVTLSDCGAKLGLDGVEGGRMAFDRVRVPRDALLDRYAQVREDGSYFSPIENPTKRFFVMLGTHFAQERLVAQLHDVFTAGDVPDRKRHELETLAAGLKAIASWHATDTIQSCREACGGAGYLRANRFAALKADTDVFTTFEGDNTVLLQLAAKNLLTDYRDQFGELDPLGLASFFAGQVIGTIAERTAVRKVLGSLSADLLPGRDDGGELLDRGEQLRLLRWRQEHVLAGVARRLKGGIDSGREPFDVLVDCQDHVVAAARAWVDLVVLEAFADAVERCPDARLTAILDRLCSLYALHTVERERGFYQEHGRLSATRSKAVIKAVNALCAELRPHAGLLVEGFGVPGPALADAEPVAAVLERAA